MTNPREVLASVPLFSMLKRKDLARLASDAHQVQYPAGMVVTEKDKSGVVFCVVVDGELSLELDGKEVKRLRPGDFFGEMALIDGQPRSAKITAETDVQCLGFTQWSFRPFALEHPEVAWALLEVMVQRVREAETRQG